MAASSIQTNRQGFFNDVVWGLTHRELRKYGLLMDTKLNSKQTDFAHVLIARAGRRSSRTLTNRSRAGEQIARAKNGFPS